MGITAALPVVSDAMRGRRERLAIGRRAEGLRAKFDPESPSVCEAGVLILAPANVVAAAGVDGKALSSDSDTEAFGLPKYGARFFRGKNVFSCRIMVVRKSTRGGNYGSIVLWMITIPWFVVVCSSLAGKKDRAEVCELVSRIIVVTHCERIIMIFSGSRSLVTKRTQCLASNASTINPSDTFFSTQHLTEMKSLTRGRPAWNHWEAPR